MVTDSEHRLHIYVDERGTSKGDSAGTNQESMEVLQALPLTQIWTMRWTYTSRLTRLTHSWVLSCREGVLDNQSWSNDLTLDYEITITKAITEIGEEPWFAPSKKWNFGVQQYDDTGNWHDYPCPFPVYTMQNKARRCARNEGAVTYLDQPSRWRKGIAWTDEKITCLIAPGCRNITLAICDCIVGRTSHAYTTEGTLLGNLDPRLAKTHGNWPILVGLNTEQDTWEELHSDLMHHMDRHWRWFGWTTLVASGWGSLHRYVQRTRPYFWPSIWLVMQRKWM